MFDLKDTAVFLYKAAITLPYMSHIIDVLNCSL